ncbi:DUF3243 domain-containing protein [Alicyclobacillus ferrooxydans]|uniref:DUF3243 domain-containing protein n=1 Tax=Alicyclobacillus ferrooxydans TaxID=471514 RepID=A0A0N8PMW9_9BACL|nr:DUF3243 domain-containing protein [Alicyclobacillus ferrooxydans]KPV39893.1 hypothetical protein AN477_21990 [Alicyclobacillus ferrooxydans]
MDTNLLENFDRWKEFLGEQVDKAQAMGMSKERITDVASKMGSFLSDKVDPKNPQERLLKQLWDAGSPDEQHTLAGLMVKMTDKAH